MSRDLVAAAFCHSLYATEIFPLGLFTLGERGDVAALVGPRSEALVFIYCTVSQVRERVGGGAC